MYVFPSASDKRLEENSHYVRIWIVTETYLPKHHSARANCFSPSVWNLPMPKPVSGNFFLDFLSFVSLFTNPPDSYKATTRLQFQLDNYQCYQQGQRSGWGSGFVFEASAILTLADLTADSFLSWYFYTSAGECVKGASKQARPPPSKSLLTIHDNFVCKTMCCNVYIWESLIKSKYTILTQVHVAPSVPPPMPLPNRPWSWYSDFKLTTQSSLMS